MRKAVLFARLLVVTFVCTLFPGASFAEVEPLAGWVTDGGDEGVSIPGKQVTIGSLISAEIDGDTSNGLESVTGTPDGQVVVVNSSGQVLWSKELPNKNCSDTSSANKLYSTPAVGELLGNGVPYVVIGYGGITSACGGGVVALRGSDGEQFWHFDTEQFAKDQGFSENLHGVFTSPALGDINNDGALEVTFGAFDRSVYLLNPKGKALWRYQAADTVWSSPSFVQGDSDKELEIVIGTDISANDAFSPPTENGGYLYLLDALPPGTLTRRDRRKARRRKKRGRGRLLKMKFVTHNFRNSSIVKWYTQVDQILQSSPVVGELVESNKGEEIVIGSGCYFPEDSKQKRGQWFKVFSLSTGELLRTLDVPACSSSTPAIADLNEDGLFEVVISANGSSKTSDGDSRLYAWTPSSDTLLWEVVPTHNGRNTSSGGQYQSPVIGDLDGNGSLEVVVANGGALHIFEGRDGTPLTCQSGDCESAPSLSGASFSTTPVIADINGDSVPELLAVSSRMFAWTNFTDALQSSPGGYAPYYLPWPMFKGSPGHGGVGQ